MGDDEVVIRGVHPLGERVGHGLRQCVGVRGPRHDHLGTLLGLVLFDRDQVGEALQRVARGGLHREDGAARIADELLQHPLLVVFGLVVELGERAHADHVAVGPHDGNGFEQVFGLVAVHHHAAFGFEFPCSLIDVEHHDVHAEVHRGLLRREARAETRIEKEHQQGLVAAQSGELVTVALDFERFGDGGAQVADICRTGEFMHIVFVLSCFVCRLLAEGFCPRRCAALESALP